MTLTRTEPASLATPRREPRSEIRLEPAVADGPIYWHENDHLDWTPVRSLARIAALISARDAIKPWITFERLHQPDGIPGIDPAPHGRSHDSCGSSLDSGTIRASRGIRPSEKAGAVHCD